MRVAGREVIEPSHGWALYRLFAIVVAVVAEDFGLRGIGGGDAGASVHEAVRLIEIGRGGDVIGNDGIVLPEFRNAIDLHGEKNRNVSAIEFAR